MVNVKDLSSLHLCWRCPLQICLALDTAARPLARSGRDRPRPRTFVDAASHLASWEQVVVSVVGSRWVNQSCKIMSYVLKKFLSVLKCCGMMWMLSVSNMLRWYTMVYSHIATWHGWVGALFLAGGALIFPSFQRQDSCTSVDFGQQKQELLATGVTSSIAVCLNIIRQVPMQANQENRPGQKLWQLYHPYKTDSQLSQVTWHNQEAARFLWGIADLRQEFLQKLVEILAICFSHTCFSWRGP